MAQVAVSCFPARQYILRSDRTKKAFDLGKENDATRERYGKNGFEKPAMVDSEGRLRDLSKVVESIGPKELAPRGLKMLAKIKPE